MNSNELPAIGAPLAGGFYAGQIRVNGALHALIVAPKAVGETIGPWHAERADVPAAASCCDGMANTRAMAEAGCPLAAWALTLSIDGTDGWYLPSRDELELLYRHFKPTSEENAVTFRDGDNPSSVPAGYPYTEEMPAQTAVAAFQEGQPEAFDEAWYWASTQCSRYNAWGQGFYYGNQGSFGVGYEARARAVRRLPLID